MTQFLGKTLYIYKDIEGEPITITTLNISRIYKLETIVIFLQGVKNEILTELYHCNIQNVSIFKMTRLCILRK